MKFSCIIAYWIGVILMGIAFLPIVLVTVIIGLLINFAERAKTSVSDLGRLIWEGQT